MKTIQNRNESYQSISDRLPKKRKVIYGLVQKHQPCTSQELSVLSMLPINEITGRIAELKNDYFLIKEHVSKDNNWTNSKNMSYTLTTIEEAVILRDKSIYRLTQRKDYLTEGLNDVDVKKDSYTYICSVITKQLYRIDRKIKLIKRGN